MTVRTPRMDTESFNLFRLVYRVSDSNGTSTLSTTATRAINLSNTLNSPQNFSWIFIQGDDLRRDELRGLARRRRLEAYEEEVEDEEMFGSFESCHCCESFIVRDVVTTSLISAPSRISNVAAGLPHNVALILSFRRGNTRRYYRHTVG